MAYLQGSQSAHSMADNLLKDNTHRWVSMTASVRGRKASTIRGPIVMSAGTELSLGQTSAEP